MKKILYVSGTRADYGLMKNTLEEINKIGKHEIIACGMHLMPEFGETYREIEKDGFKVSKINAVYDGAGKEPMARFTGKLIVELTQYLEENRSDTILTLGDRAEMLAAAVTGTYLSIPVAHIHGGEVSGTVDEHIRHAITKLAHLHLPATEKSAKRIEKMGEEKWRIHVVGAPGLDGIVGIKYPGKKEVFEKFNLNPDKKLILVLQHPVTEEYQDAGKQIKNTLDAVSAFDANIIVIYPNADTGSEEIIKAIKNYKKIEEFKVFKNIKHSSFLSLLKYADVLVGNSSCGIIEAASFKTPVVNIGTRQQGRERAVNVIDSGYGRTEIENAVKKATTKDFLEKIKDCKNPYGDGRSAGKIADILSKTEIDKRLLEKKLTY